MIVRVLTRACAGLAVVALVAACDDNPLAENRDRGAWFDLNPSHFAVVAGDSVRDINAIVRNQYGASINAAVTATPCDAKISAVRDTSRSIWEAPERFVVTGHTLGHTCLVVSGAGLTDTIRVRVVPASFRTSGVTVVGSGETATAQVEFFDAAGNPVTGMSLADLRWTSLTTNIAAVDSLTGEIRGQAPGQGMVLARLSPEHGATRVDTLRFTVQAGTFTGTYAPNPALEGHVVTITAGNNLFDSDTNVQFAGLSTWILSRSETQIQAIVPGGLQPQTQFAVTNIGPNQIASVGTMNIAGIGLDRHEPNNTLATATPIAVGDTAYLTISMVDDDWFRLTLPAARAVNFHLQWFGSSDVDMEIYTSGGALAATGCATAANPENCSYNIPAGTWYLKVSMYEAGTPAVATVRFRVSPL